MESTSFGLMNQTLDTLFVGFKDSRSLYTSLRSSRVARTLGVYPAFLTFAHAARRWSRKLRACGAQRCRTTLLPGGSAAGDVASGCKGGRGTRSLRDPGCRAALWRWAGRHSGHRC
eukprot:2685700-Prymnesium_polylepis.2